MMNFIAFVISGSFVVSWIQLGFFDLITILLFVTLLAFFCFLFFIDEKRRIESERITREEKKDEEERERRDRENK